MKKEFLIKTGFFLMMMFMTFPISAQLPGRFNNENKIIISGESNIQNFVVKYYFKRKLRATEVDSSDCSSSKSGVIRIPVHKLLFSNKHMKNDFLNLVDAEQFPYIKLFYDPSLLSQIKTNNRQDIPITIEITNVRKTYMVPISLLKQRTSFSKLKGQVRIKLSDFKLKPKRYFFGLIRLKDTLKINFILYFYRQVT